MTDQDNMPELNGTNGTSDPPSDTTPENTFETPPEVKMAPPVAPKPIWFRQSLRKLRDEQGQKKQAKAAEQRPAVVFNRSSGVRSTSSAANLSIKQKIHSSVAPSASLPLEKESGSPPFSHGNCGKGEHKIPEEIQASVKETDSTHVSAITSSASEASSQTTAKETEDEPPSIQSPTDLLLSETISEELDSGIHDSHSAPVHDDRNVFPSKQECELEREHLTRSTECEVLPPVTSVRSSEAEGESPPEGTEEDGAQSQGKLQTPATDSNAPRGLEGESLERILAFSNQVSQALMHSLPMYQCHGNPHTPDLQDPSAEDFNDPGPDSSDRGFSVSLATLRECTIERGEGGSHDQAALTSARAHSLISAIPSQEIQRMIQEVQDLDEETLKQLVDIHVVSLHKEEGAGLGFSIAGGSDLESKAPTVHRVFPSGLAAQEGTIQKGDEVLSINGQTLRGVTHADATAALRQARSLKLAVVVVCKRAEEGREEGCRSEEPHPAEEEQGAPVSVELEKTAGGVGFTLEGGKGSIHGDRPLVINRIFTGGAAEQIGLQRGDELLQVQGVSLQDMTRFEAWNMIKALPEGAITAVIRRRQGGAE
uniref:Pro-interleukin-16 n=1 Tax=Sander lucioperca TaxID=283035 RepID=A0A8C9ZZE5_SANLU